MIWYSFQLYWFLFSASKSSCKIIRPDLFYFIFTVHRAILLSYYYVLIGNLHMKQHFCVNVIQTLNWQKQHPFTKFYQTHNCNFKNRVFINCFLKSLFFSNNTFWNHNLKRTWVWKWSGESRSCWRLPRHSYCIDHSFPLSFLLLLFTISNTARFLAYLW